MGLSQKFLTPKSWPPSERCQKLQILMNSKGVPEAGNSDAESNEKYAQALKTFEMSHWRELCVYSIALTPTQKRTRETLERAWRDMPTAENLDGELSEKCRERRALTNAQ